jgi:biotin carboxylase
LCTLSADAGVPAYGTVLVSNRGEIARRVIKTCKRLGVPVLAVYTNADALAPHVKEATSAACLGANPRSYTNQELLLQVGSLQTCGASHMGRASSPLTSARPPAASPRRSAAAAALPQ